MDPIATTGLLGITSGSRLPKSLQPFSAHPARTSSLIVPYSANYPTRTDQPCSVSKQGEPASSDVENQTADELANKIVDKIRSVNRPIVIGDFYAQRFGFGEEMRGLCGALGIRYFGSEFSSVLGMFQGRDPDRRVIFFRSQSCQVSLPSQCQLRQRLVPWY